MSQSLQENKSQELEHISPQPKLIEVGTVILRNDSPKLATINSGTISFGFATIYPPNYGKELAIWTTLNAHSKQLEGLRKTNVISEDDMQEVLKQHELLLRNYSLVEHLKGKTVVACGGDLFVGDTVDDAVKKAREKHGEKPYYAEAINLIGFTSLFPPNADKL